MYSHLFATEPLYVMPYVIQENNFKAVKNSFVRLLLNIIVNGVTYIVTFYALLVTK